MSAIGDGGQDESRELRTICTADHDVPKTSW